MKQSDKHTDRHFETTADGRQIFYPWGLLGGGYIVPTGTDLRPIQTLLSRRSSALSFADGFAGSPGTIVALMLLPLSLYVAWNQRRVLKLVSSWTRIAPAKPDAKELARKAAAEKPHIAELAFWIVLMMSVLLTLGGIGFLFAIPSTEWLPFLAGIAVTAACAAYCLRKLASLRTGDLSGN